ncbi:MAG: ParB N-terminal domain-containing protein [Chloroflexota bacterium]
MMPPKNSRRMETLLDSIGAQLMVADPEEHLSDHTLRVEYIPADLLRPDPVQPRRVLPEALHFAFHEDRLTPVQALRELVQLAQVTARQSGRPFSGPLDLLSSLESDEDAEAPKLTPEEALVRDLANLAMTIRDDGQVNPLTVVDASQGVTRLYRIETGERRYWATWLLRDFLPSYEGDGTIPCILIPSGKASVFRQAKENTARSGLSAIAMARQAALLILAVHNVEKPDGPVSHDFYRQALGLDLRDKREHTTAILSAMGGITKAHLWHYKSLLKLSDEALELADRHSLDEFRLRYVLNLPTDAQGEMVRQIITFNLTGRQIKEMCEQSGDTDQSDEYPLSKEAHRFARMMCTLTPALARDLAQVLLTQEKDIHLARARIQTMKKLINDTEAYLEDH